MEQNCPSIIEQLPPEDWEKTPASVKKMVELMALRIEILVQLGVSIQTIFVVE
jgi:hypothetical protein